MKSLLLAVVCLIGALLCLWGWSCSKSNGQPPVVPSTIVYDTLRVKILLVEQPLSNPADSLGYAQLYAARTGDTIYCSIWDRTTRVVVVRNIPEWRVMQVDVWYQLDSSWTPYNQLMNYRELKRNW